MINVPNNDSHIINRDSLLIELTRTMIERRPIVIELNGEGPCAESLGLYSLLDRLTQQFNYNKDNITIITCNLLEQHSEYKIRTTPQMMYLMSARSFVKNNVLRSKEFNIEFCHFGNFIGHSNAHRLHIASHLHQHYKHQTLQSYHYNRHSDYHKMFVGFEDMLYNHYSESELDCAYSLIKQSPITQDSVDTYPILNPATLNITKLYHKFFLEVVNLTYFSGTTFYIDEKIWRPMIMKTPMLIQGPQNYIVNLRKLGFKTFDRWWDEGYSEDPSSCQNNGIIANLIRLAKLSVTELEQMYSDMMPVLDHNFDLLNTLTTQQIEKQFRRQ